MAILKVARMGHPILARPAEAVDDPSAAEIQRLIDDMIETMQDANAAGLAAPQVHVPLRVVVFHVPAARAESEEGAVPVSVLLNPVIQPLDADTQVGYEGCLSLPGLTGAVPRWCRIRYAGLDRDGRPLDCLAEGFHARVVQHECDHLDGILYPQRMPDLGRFGFVEEMRRGLDREG